jgi:hypothetical protein
VARTVTLAQIRDRVRELCDAEQMRALSDLELNKRLSSSYARYYAKLVKPGLGFPSEVTQTITATATDTYPLPDDHFSTMRIDYRNGSLWQPLWEVDIREIHRVEIAGQGGPSQCYRLAGGNLILYPVPAVAGLYRHIYAPAPADLTVDSQTLDGVCGWEEAVILDAAIRAAMKWEGDTNDLRAERNLLDERIDAEVQLRSINTAKRIVIRDRRDGYEADPTDPADFWPWR